MLKEDVKTDTFYPLLARLYVKEGHFERQAIVKGLTYTLKGRNYSPCSPIRHDKIIKETFWKNYNNHKVVSKGNKGNAYTQEELQMDVISKINAKVLSSFYNLSKL